VTARPALALAPPPDPDGPAPRGPRHWLFLAREALGYAGWRAVAAVLAAVATAGMRERAWAEGFAVALGSGARHRRYDHLDEWHAGNEAGWDLRERAGTPASAGLKPRFGGLKPWDKRSAALAVNITRLLGDDPARPVARVPLVAVTLPAAAVAPLAALSDSAVGFPPPGGTFPTGRSDTWPPLVRPRPTVASAGRHVAPGGTAGPPAACPGWAAPRHRRPSPVRLAGRWLREVLGWRDVAAGRHGRTGDLSAAA